MEKAGTWLILLFVCVCVLTSLSEGLRNTHLPKWALALRVWRRWGSEMFAGVDRGFVRCAQMQTRMRSVARILQQAGGMFVQIGVLRWKVQQMHSSTRLSTWILQCELRMHLPRRVGWSLLLWPWVLRYTLVERKRDFFLIKWRRERFCSEHFSGYHITAGNTFRPRNVWHMRWNFIILCE